CIANAFDAGNLVHILEQHRKVGNAAVLVESAPVSVHVLPQKGDFLHALIGQVGNFHQYVFKGPRDFGAAGVGHDTETAVFAAAFHDRHERRGAFDAGRWQGVELFDFGEADVDLGMARAVATGDQLGQAVQGLRAEDDIDKGRARDNGFAFLAGDTAAYADDHLGVQFLEVTDTAEIREHFFLRFFTHRTGVEQDDVGFFGRVHPLCTVGLAQDVDHLV